MLSHSLLEVFFFFNWQRGGLEILLFFLSFEDTPDIVTSFKIRLLSNEALNSKVVLNGLGIEELDFPYGLNNNILLAY